LALTKIPGYTLETNLEWLNMRTLFLTRHGSHAYGTNTPTSDLDVKGVCVPPREYYHGFVNHFEQAEFRKPLDAVIYELRKFFSLAADCNPNIIEVLWTAESDHLYMSGMGDDLLSARELFLSKKARYTFAGYAHAQLKRIRTHRNWLLYPPKTKPDRKEFGLPEFNKVADKEQMAAAAYLNEHGYGYGTNFQDLVEREKQYKVAMVQWDQFQTWQTNRNAARHELEAKYGYDTKHGMHLVRLLRMCEEILRDGTVHVKRPDAEELLTIRNGAWSYDQLIEWAERQDAKMDELYKTSPLPREPDRHSLDLICMELIEEW
jgi:predicted nucleotidyltransferase